MTHKKEPPLPEAFMPVLILLPLLGLNVWLFGDRALSGYNQFALLVAAAVGVLLGFRRGIKWAYIETGIVKTVSTVIPAVIILLFIGSLAGTWMLSGVIPSFIYYGIEMIHPSVFLPACCISCALISMATGSSWTTVATIGLALMGIGEAMGYGIGMVAGAIISGAYFGDKMSPLSDTTNMAAAVAGTDLFTHIRYMGITTMPAMALSLVLFAIVGWFGQCENPAIRLSSLQTELNSTFEIHLWILIIPAIVILMIMKRVSPIPALFTGTLLGMAGALVFQSSLLQSLSDASNTPKYVVIFSAAITESTVTQPNSPLYDLLHSRGMAGMLNTIWLIICAMGFGGVLDATGSLKKIAETILLGAKNAGGLVARTVSASTLFNITASDQYLSIVVPGRMFKPAFEKMKLSPQNLSRSLEDGGTVTSVLVPWNTCGATQSAVLGVATIVYLPWCFFNLLCPLMSILIAYSNFKISKS